MTHSPANYQPIPSSEDQAYHSDIHEAGVGANGLFSTSEWIRTEARTKWTYFLLGCAMWLPWSALMNGAPFFLSRLVGSPIYATFTSYLSSVYMLSKLISQFYSTFTSKQSSPSRRIFASVILAMLLIASLCISTFIRGTPSVFFLFAMFSAASLAVTCGYLCTAVYAVASLLGPSFLQTVISGHAAVGVATSAVQVVSSMISLSGYSPKSVSAELTIADSRDDLAEELAARISFGVSAMFLGVMLAAYTWLTRQPLYKSSTGSLEQHGEVRETDELTGLVTNVRRNSPTTANTRVYHVFRRNWSFMFSIAYVFVVTLAVFPAITVRVRSMNAGIHPMLFTAVHFLVFNTGDLVGRYTCSFPRLVIWSANKILAMSLLRTLFIPLVLLCNIHRPETITPVSPIISSDFLFMMILLTMGYTNGYVAAMAVLAVSSLEHNPMLEGRREDVDIAATLGGSFAIAGLTAGALCSFAVQAMI